MAEARHIFELLVEIEPFRPGIEMLAAVRATQIIVAAAVVRARSREISALAQLVENRPRPPVEMRIDNVHGALLPIGCFQTILVGGPHPVNAGCRPVAWSWTGNSAMICSRMQRKTPGERDGPII